MVYITGTDTVTASGLINLAATVLLVLTTSCCNGMPQVSPRHVDNKNDSIKRYPYLAENGLYGYVNGDMDLLIPAKFASASHFTATGYAVVSEPAMPAHRRAHRYGVINTAGETVLPDAHDRLLLQVVAGRTLVWLRHDYVNRWRFWEWGGILLGTQTMLSDNGKLIDTRVDRSAIQLRVLETNQLIASTRTHGRADPTQALPVSAMDSLRFRQGKRAFRLTKKKNGKTVFVREKGDRIQPLAEKNEQAAAEARWPKGADIIPQHELVEGWHVVERKAITASRFIARIVPKDTKDQQSRQGVWDLDAAMWVWAPLNMAIEPLDEEYRYWSYREERGGQYGLYDLVDQKKITPPRYDRVYRNGFVRMESNSTDFIEFHVDWKTGREFRAIPAP